MRVKMSVLFLLLVFTTVNGHSISHLRVRRSLPVSSDSDITISDNEIKIDTPSEELLENNRVKKSAEDTLNDLTSLDVINEGSNAEDVPKNIEERSPQMTLNDVDKSNSEEASSSENGDDIERVRRQHIFFKNPYNGENTMLVMSRPNPNGAKAAENPSDVSGRTFGHLLNLKGGIGGLGLGQSGLQSYAYAAPPAPVIKEQKVPVHTEYISPPQQHIQTYSVPVQQTVIKEQQVPIHTQYIAPQPQQIQQFAVPVQTTFIKEQQVPVHTQYIAQPQIQQVAVPVQTTVIKEQQVPVHTQYIAPQVHPIQTVIKEPQIPTQTQYIAPQQYQASFSTVVRPEASFAQFPVETQFIASQPAVKQQSLIAQVPVQQTTSVQLVKQQPISQVSLQAQSIPVQLPPHPVIAAVTGHQETIQQTIPLQYNTQQSLGCICPYAYNQFGQVPFGQFGQFGGIGARSDDSNRSLQSIYNVAHRPSPQGKSADNTDSDCSIENLSNMHLDKRVMEGLTSHEEMKLKKIEECAKNKKLNDMEYAALLNMVHNEINLLQREVKGLQAAEQQKQLSMRV